MPHKAKMVSSVAMNDILVLQAIHDVSHSARAVQGAQGYLHVMHFLTSGRTRVSQML